MAGKFRIFCDDCPTNFEPEDKPGLSQPNQAHHQQQQQQASQHPAKREPLGLRQTISHQRHLQQKHQQQQQQQQHQHQHHQPLSQQHQQQLSQQSHVLQELPTASLASSATLSSTVPSVNEEDQENDISMASLGSDFIPSILHDDADFVEDNSFEISEDEIATTHTTEVTTEDDDLHYGALITENEFADFEVDDEDLDDEELQLELSQAFKRHDDSQLFKSTIYIHDIDCYLNELESDLELRPLPNYMAFQNDIDSNKRAILFNWLIEVADEYELQTETLFICTGILDRFLSLMSVPTSKFQLLGVAAMFIASKYEEIYPPYLNQFVEVTDDTYSAQQIREMEQEILKALNFRISHATITLFLRRIFAFNKFSKKVYHMAEYLCHLSLLADQPFLEYRPSEIAISAVILAAHQLGAAESITSELKQAYDESNQAQLDRRRLPKDVKKCDIDRRAYIVDKDLPFCIESLRAIQERAYTRSLAPLTQADSAVYVKYSTDSQSRVSLLAPPKVEDLSTY